MTTTEQMLNEILCEVTGEARDFPLHEQLSEHGIDSFLALRLIRGIEDRTGLAIEMAALFDYPTIAELAQFIGSQDIPATSGLLPA